MGRFSTKLHDSIRPAAYLADARCDEYRVVASSSNMNSFGLYQFVFMNRDGKSFKMFGNSLRKEEYPPKSQVVLDRRGFAAFGFECVEELTVPPMMSVIREVWRDDQ